MEFDIEKLREQFSHNLREIMKRKGYSVDSLAAVSGLNESTIYHYQAACSRHNPNFYTVAILCNALEVSSSELLGF